MKSLGASSIYHGEIEFFFTKIAFICYDRYNNNVHIQ